MLRRRCDKAAPTASPLDDARLRGLVVDFLALNEQPGHWTFVGAAPLTEPMIGRPLPPDIVLDVGGRIAYVEIRRQGGGPLPPGRAAGLELARSRAAACFVVRSLPDMERALRTLGIQLRAGGRLLDDNSTESRNEQEDADARPS